MFKEILRPKSIIHDLENQLVESGQSEDEIKEVLRQFVAMFERKEISSQLEEAIKIALKMHEGQKDKADAPYIWHPLRLLTQMETEDERIVAVLHDVIEDSGFTPDDLHDAGFPQQIIEAVTVLTRDNSDTYAEFIKKVKLNHLARRVKLADLRDNSRIERISQPTEKDISRLKRYEKAIEVLESE